MEPSPELLELAKELVNTGRVKKLVETRCIAAFNSNGNQIITNEEMFKLAVDITASVETFVETGLVFERILDREGVAKTS